MVCQHALDTSIFMHVSPTFVVVATCRRNLTSVSTYYVWCLPSDKHLIGHLPKMNRTTLRLSVQRQDTLLSALFPLAITPVQNSYMWEPQSVSLQSDSSASLDNHRFKTLHFIAVKRKSVEMNIKCVLRSWLALRFQGVSRTRHDVLRA